MLLLQIQKETFAMQIAMPGSNKLELVIFELPKNISYFINDWITEYLRFLKRLSE